MTGDRKAHQCINTTQRAIEIVLALPRFRSGHFNSEPLLEIVVKSPKVF